MESKENYVVREKHGKEESEQLAWPFDEIEALQPAESPQEEKPIESLSEELKLTITPTDLARIIYAARGGNPFLFEREQEPGVLSAIGDGLHRMADGAREIVGGMIDIITLGRATRR